MRIALVWLAVWFAVASSAHTQSVPTYSLLRENEDWSVLRDKSLRHDIWDPLKYIRLGSDDWYLTIGGEVREVFEQVGNDNWGKQRYTNTFVLERYMLHSDWHLGPHFRAFVQLKSGLEFSRASGARPIDEKKLDFEAAFFEARTSGKNWIALRVGRQELNYGSGRLISVREGPNVRQSFDGFKVMSTIGSWNIDAFAARPDLDKPGFFNNSPDYRTTFWGIYASRPRTGRFSIDVYYTGLDRKVATYNRGTGQELRHSVAARLWRPVQTKERGWDLDYEGVWQFGAFGSSNIRAWTFASDTGYSLPNLPFKPRLSVKSDISSGDDPRHNSLGTFNAYFRSATILGCWPTRDPDRRISLTCTRGFRSSLYAECRFRRILLPSGGRTSTTEFTRYLVFCSSRPTAAELASSAIDPEWKFDGRSVDTLTFRRTTAFSTPASS
jgi:Alginate export